MVAYDIQELIALKSLVEQANKKIRNEWSNINSLLNYTIVVDTNFN